MLYFRFELRDGEIIVLEREECLKENQNILELNQIPFHMRIQ